MRGPLRDQVVGLELAIVEAIERAPSFGALGEGIRDIGMARQTLALARELSSQRADQGRVRLRRAANRSAGGSPASLPRSGRSPGYRPWPVVLSSVGWLS